MGDEEMECFKIEDLSFRYPTGESNALDNINLVINQGEFVTLCGKSGCGKTTTGRSIIRLYDITGGSVYFNGKRIKYSIEKITKNVIKKDTIRSKINLDKILTNKLTGIPIMIIMLMVILIGILLKITKLSRFGKDLPEIHL